MKSRRNIFHKNILPPSGTVFLDGKRISYAVKISRRAKYIRLSVQPDSGLRIVLPARPSGLSLEDLLQKHKGWILKRIDRQSRQKQLPFPLTIKDGSSLPLLHKTYQLRLAAPADKKDYMSWDDGILKICLGHPTRPRVEAAVIAWYKEMTRRFLEERIPVLSSGMPVSPRSFRVKNQRTLWGSCSRKGNLNFNWRIMLLTPEAADYLIIHECAHLRHLNHSGKFWKTVETFCPGYKKHKAEIRKKNAWLEKP